MLCPDLVSHYSVFRYIRILQNALVIVAVLLMALYYKNRFFRVTMYLFGAFLLATVINHSSYSTVWYYFARSFGLIVISYYLSKVEGITFWRVMSDYLAVCAYLNTLVTFVYPRGLITVQSVNLVDKGIYLLGEQNQIIPYYLIAVAIAMIYHQFSGEKKLRAPLILICSIATELIYKSSTTAVGIVLFLLVSFVDFGAIAKRIRGRISTRVSIVLIVIAIALIYYLVVVVRIQNKFGDLIFFLFRKDATFSTRTSIWDYAFQMIKAKPVFGYGGRSTRYIAIGTRLYNSHNIFLQYMLMGGIVMTAVFVWLIVLSVINASKIEQKRIKMTYIALFVAYFVMSLTEVYAMSLAIFVLFLPILILECKAFEPVGTSNGVFQETEERSLSTVDHQQKSDKRWSAPWRTGKI